MYCLEGVDILLKAEIWDVKNPDFYIPYQLLSWISEPSTVSKRLGSDLQTVFTMSTDPPIPRHEN